MKKLTIAFVLFFTVGLTTATAQTSAPAAPVFEILTPKEGQTLYGSKVPILFNVENFELVDKEATVATAGEGHILVWLDQENPTAENATRVVENTFIFSDVAYAGHSLKAELVTSDNKSLNPPLTKTVNFKTEILPSEEQATISSGFDKQTAIVILVVVALVILAAWWYTKDEDDDIDSEENLSKPKRKSAKKTQTKAKTKKKTKR